MSSLVKRCLVAFSLGPLIILIFWLGGYYLTGFLTLLSILLILEFTKAIQVKFLLIQRIILILLVILQIILMNHLETKFLIPLYCISISLIAGLELVNKIEFSLERLSISFFILIYFGLSLALVGKIRAISPLHGLFPLGIVWITDTFAYFAGRAFGKHKMAKTISPNKTIEGLIGGAFGAMAVGVVFHLIEPESFPLLWMLILGFILAFIVQMGDLVASKIKREYALKDFSNIIPGHGGFVDRFDSFVFVMPALFFIFYYIL